MPKAKKVHVLVGKTVKDVRLMSKEEQKREGWDHGHTSVIEFTDGTVAYASQDDEGNGPGALFGVLSGAPVRF